jgi:hypothetical protein
MKAIGTATPMKIAAVALVVTSNTIETGVVRRAASFRGRNFL